MKALLFTGTLLLTLCSCEFSHARFQEPDAAAMNGAPQQGAPSKRDQKIAAAITGAINVLIPGGIEGNEQRKAGFAEAVSMFQRGQAKSTLEHLEKMCQNDPELPPAKMLLAGLTFSVGDNPSGIALLEQCAAENTEYPGVYLSFAQLALNSGRVTDAVAHSEKTRRLLNESKFSADQQKLFQKQYLEILSGIFMRRQKFEQARATLGKLDALSPGLPFYYYTLAEIEFRAGAFDKTLDLLRKRTEKVNSEQLPEITLIEWFRRDKKNDLAEKLLGETIIKHPDKAQLHLMNGSMLLAKEQFSEALVAVNKYEKIEGATIPSVEIKARVAFAGQSYSVAEAHFGTLVDRVPTDLSFRNTYALCLIESDDVSKQQEALKISQQVATRMTRNPLALASLGYILLKSGNKPAANQIMGRIAATQMGSPEITYLIAQWQYEMGQKETAKKLLEKSIKVNSLFLYRSAAKSMLQKVEAELAE